MAINEQIPPGIMGEANPVIPAGVQPEVPVEAQPELPPEVAPGIDPSLEQVPEEGIIEGGIQSDALNMDEEKASKAALKMITSAKEHLYGEGFDQYMEVAQSSENVVEDAAMITIDLLVPELNASESLGMGTPISHLMDTIGEIVNEVYDFFAQTGTYIPSSEEEVARNQNISVTMVAGELGKEFGSEGDIPPEEVSNFIDGVLGGEYDDQSGQEEVETPEEMPMGPELPPEIPPGEEVMMAEGGMPGAMPGELPPEIPVEEMPV